MRRRDFLCTTLASVALAPLAQAATTDVGFSNDDWQVRIDPATLEISVTPRNQPALVVSDGFPARAVADLKQTPDAAQWRWGTVRVTAALSGRDLNLSFTVEAPETLELLRQPATAMGRGLILPLAEGRYAPSDSPEWRADLLNAHNDINTTEDLTLPLWGMDHGAFTLHWLLGNPFNNQLSWPIERADSRRATTPTSSSSRPTTGGISPITSVALWCTQ